MNTFIFYLQSTLSLHFFPKSPKPNWLLAPYKLSLVGSKGVPLKGDPSAFQAFLSISYYSSSSVVGKPIFFLYYSYIIFLNAP